MTDKSHSALEFLTVTDEELVSQCEIHIYKASGPGGQHRNKVSSAVRLHHKPTGITATANDSRSQHDNKKLAISRLRMNIAVKVRKAICVEPDDFKIPAVLAECIFVPKKTASLSSHKLQVGKKDFRFWTVASILLDMLDGAGGALGKVAACLSISTGNLTKFFKTHRHLIEAVQNIRKKYNLKPIN